MAKLAKFIGKGDRTTPPLKKPSTPIKKDDFKTATKLAKELGMEKETVVKAMRILRKKTIVVENQQKPIIIGDEERKYKLNPLAMNIFLQCIEKQKAKQ